MVDEWFRGIECDSGRARRNIGERFRWLPPGPVAPAGEVRLLGSDAHGVSVELAVPAFDLMTLGRVDAE